MNKKLQINLSISPQNSLGKNSLYLLVFLVFLVFIFFSLIFLNIGAWPISIFMGVEYIIMAGLFFLFYQKRKTTENIKIDENNLTYKFYKKKKLINEITLSTYWARIKFWKKENKSKLILIQSSNKFEIAKSINTKNKEEIYFKINKYLKN